MRKAISLSIITAGFTAMASQIVFMRELLVVFYGNELSISFIFGGWLIGGSLGSALLGRFADRIKAKIAVFASCQVVLSLSLPLAIAASRLIKSVIHVNPGEIIPLFSIITGSFIILAPIAALLGFLFALGCRMYGEPSSAGVEKIARVYVLEAIGAIAGGAITSLVLIQFLDSLHIAGAFAALNCFSAFILIASAQNTKLRKFTLGIITIFIIALLSLWFSGAWSKLDRALLNKQWSGYNLVASKNSIYGNIAIVKRGEDYSFFENGLHLYTIPDRLNAEESVHLALLEHPDPKDILLIGGGVGGLIEEILKHDVKKVDYVELDPLIIKMAEEYLPQSYYEALKDPRVSIKNTDGRFFVKTTKNKYDCVLLDVGDPYTAQGNRYYTVEFFKEVRDILNYKGIVSFGLNSSESYISPALGEFLQSIYATLNCVFADCIAIPGEKAYFLASDKKGMLTYDYRVLEDRTKERMLNTLYVRDYYLSSRLSPEKIAYLQKVLSEKKYIRINYDFHPSAYYYDLIFWTTLFRDSLFSKALKSVTAKGVWQAVAVFIILTVLFLSYYRRSFRNSALASVMMAGFSSMAFQLVILLSFQIVCGYLFYKLGFIMTAFMAGLALGSFFVVKMIPMLKWERIMLIAVQADLFIFSILLAAIFFKVKIMTPSMFPVLSCVAGFIGGFQFTTANRVLLGDKGSPSRIGGLSYGVDLAGSCFGALLTGVFLIPILGIPQTCLAIGLINAAILLILCLNLRVED